MEAWIEFGRGPLFRICFAIMILGLLRAVALSLFGMIEALHRAGDHVVPWGDLWKKTFSWLIPIKNLFTKRPVYSVISFVWHIGLILVPLFLTAHVLLFWNNSVGVTWWPTLPQNIADTLTLVAIIAGSLLWFGRVLNRNARFLSRPQDIMWPPLLTVTFLTGYLCAATELAASSYQVSMLIHIYTANTIMILIPFTKVAHCVLMPMSQFVSAIGWKFPRGAGKKVAKTLGREGMPV